ncbi:ribosome biosynthesis protein rrb1 [Clydaea vesicula]|uniref:Ribosome biosynthesis protein rrb1 n=1 Tax=Clydaea vesicula TaxID=447962 RepID=A0AAD5U3Z4_9FUNG|nr:ribosome biosynthesis protein rrb1 [Clydaea vesicula]
MNKRKNLNQVEKVDAKKNVKSNKSKEKIENEENVSDLEYEDVYEDEIEEEVVVEQKDEEEEIGEDDLMEDIDDNDDENEENVKVYLPGQEIEPEHVLLPDNSAYLMLHQMGVEWPCLSFDIIKDKLGLNRTQFPATSYIVSGSQAPNPNENKIYVMKMSQLHKTKNDDLDEDMIEEDDDENDLDEDPILEHREIPHYCGVNRIRLMEHPEQQICATWSEEGRVNIYDITQHVLSLDTPGLIPDSNLLPLHAITNHNRIEGYAMDWSTKVTGRIVTGDCKGKIYITSKNQSGFQTDSQPYKGHNGSCEDLQWSPTEKDVFASCGVDGTVKIWDVRMKQSALSIKAHNCDVNVIAWNKKVDYLLASGSDNGIFSVWDLRTFGKGQETATSAATFNWHKKAITSIEWHPFETSMLACSGADDQLTLWDLSLEADLEEQQVMEEKDGRKIEVPAQLLFIHQGQSNIKELHFHEQIPGCIISTSSDGFNIFKTINS